MSRRKQGRPQQRRTLDALEQENDLLVCGECQTSFPLRDILKFIKHKISKCKKDNEDGNSNENDDDEDPETTSIRGISLKRTSISAPISRKESLETRLSPLFDCNDDIKENDELSPDEEQKPVRPPLKLKQRVDAESNTTHTEPSKFVCDSCKATFESAWFLLQHAQREHGMKIYYTPPLFDTLPVNKNPDITAKELHDSKRSPQLPQTPKLHHDDHRDHHINILREHHRTPPSAGSSGGSADASIITSHHSPNPFMFRFPFDRPPLSPSMPFSRPPAPDFITSEPRHMGLLNFPHFDGPSPAFPHLFDRAPRPLGFDNKTLESFYSQRLRELASRDPPSGSPPGRKLTPPFSQAGTTTTSLFQPLPTQQPSPHPVESERSQRPDSLTPPNKLKSCEFCGKSFRFQSNLIVHRRSHTGEKPFKCPLCPHACTQQSKLKRHMKTHMNKSSILTQISNSSDGGNHGSGDSTPEGNKKFPEDEDEDEDEEEEMEDEEEEIDECEMMEDEISDNRKLSNNNLEKKPEINIFHQNLIPPHSRNGGLANNFIQDKSSLLKEVMENSGLTGIPTYKDAFKQALEENFSKENLGRERSKESQDNGSRNGSISSKDEIKSEPETNLGNAVDSKQSNSEAEHNQSKPVKSEPLEAAPPMFNFDMFSSLSQSLWRLPGTHPPPEMYPLIPGYHFDPNHNNGFNSVPPVESALKTYSTQKSSDNLSSANSSPLPRKEASRRNDTCEFCGKVFRNCSNLTVHRRSHTGEKPYKCALCSYACAQSSKLTRHMRTHGRIGKDVYRCKFCSMPFSVASTLEKHMRKCVGNGQVKMLTDSDSQQDSSRMMQDSESDSSNAPSNVYDSSNPATSLYESANTPTSIFDSTKVSKNMFDSTNVPTSIFDSAISSASLYDSPTTKSLFESGNVPTSPFDSSKVKRESSLFDSVNATPTI